MPSRDLSDDRQAMRDLARWGEVLTPIERDTMDDIDDLVGD